MLALMSYIQLISQTVIISENMGSPSGTTAIASHTFQNSPTLTYSGTADVRITTPSTGYTGSSGSGNVFFGTSGGNAKEFLISGINTSAYTSISLSFGVLSTSANSMLTVEVSSDGTNYTALTVNTTITANTWTLKTATGSIPAASNLRLKFSKNSIVSYRLDDVIISGTLASTPLITVLPTSLTGFTYVEGSGPSAEQSFTASGSNLTANITVTAPTGYEVSTTSGSGFAASVILPHTGGTVNSTTVYARLKADLEEGSYAGDISLTSTGATAKTVALSGTVTVIVAEPSNHPTNFTATANTTTSLTVAWTDATPAAEGYLIKGSTTSYESITAPVDGSAVADATLVKNVAAGVEMHQFTGLTQATTHFFKIWPYNGSGTSINYLTSGTVPQTSATTQSETPSVTLTGTDPGTSDFVVGSSNNVLYRIAVAVQYNTVTLNQLVITTSGTYLPADVAAGGFKLWYSTNNTFGSDTELGSLSAVTGGGENLTFTGLTQAFAPGTNYLFVTANIDAAATTTHTIGAAADANGDFTFAAALNFSGSTFGAGNLHTIANAITLLLNENFDYTVGTLLTANGYTAHSGTDNPITVTASTMTYPGYLSSGVGNEISLSSSAEDVNKTFSERTSGTTYFGLLVNVSSVTTTGDYFFNVGATTIGSTFRGRVFVKKNASEKLAFGIAQSTTVANFSEFNYNLNETYFLILKYEIILGATNDIASLIINPVLNINEPVAGWISNTDAASTDLANLGSFAFRQGNSTNGPVLKIDGIRVATTWQDIVGPQLIFSGTGNWNETGRWSSATLPSVNSAATINGSATVSTAIAVTDLSVNNTKSVTVANTGQLTVSGTLTNSAGNSGLVIKSDATGTGSLIHNTADVAATVERYVTGNSNLTAFDYHLVSVPLDAAVTNAQFMGSYLYHFDAATQSWTSNGTSTTAPVPVNAGYMIYYPNASTTYNFTGELNNGSFTAATGLDAADEFALVPNPYPSAIDWNAASGWTKTNLRDAIYVWDPVGNQYAAFGAEAGINNGTRYIPAGQAFFVKSSAASTVLAMNNSVRVHNTQTFWKEGDLTKDLLRVKALGNGLSDELVLRFRQGTEAGLDLMDVDKLFGADEAPQLFTLTTDERQLSINTQPYSQQTVVVPMGFELKKDVEVSLNFSGIEAFEPTVNIFLEDCFTGQMVNLRENPVYTFNHTQGNEPQRFKLHLMGVTAVGETPSAMAGQIWSDGNSLYLSFPELQGQKALYELFDLNGRLLESRVLSLETIQRLRPQASGIVIARVSLANQVYVNKLFIR